MAGEHADRRIFGSAAANDDLRRPAYLRPPHHIDTARTGAVTKGRSESIERFETGDHATGTLTLARRVRRGS